MKESQMDGYNLMLYPFYSSSTQKFYPSSPQVSQSTQVSDSEAEINEMKRKMGNWYSSPAPMPCALK